MAVGGSLKHLFDMGKQITIFDFDMPQGGKEIDATNINGVRLFLSDDEKIQVEDLAKKLFSKYSVDNISDLFIKILQDAATKD